MSEWVLRYADPRGEIRQQVAIATTEKELRDRYTQQGFLIYSVRPKGQVAGISTGFASRKKKINLEKFLIFNQQFVTLVKAGLPILKSLDLLADRLTDPKLGVFIQAVRDEVHNGALLSDAFQAQGVFPPIYVTSVLAGERSGSLSEVLERFIAYQKMALAVRKKLLLSLVYPTLLIILVICLMVFLITYVVPSFAELYNSMSAQLPLITQILIAVGTTARGYILTGFLALIGALVAFRFWARTERGREMVERAQLKVPLAGEIWIKYQVAQFSRTLSTLIVGGIPLLQALDTAASSLGMSVLRKALGQAAKSVKEGKSLSASLAQTKIFPGLSIDMMEVGESTGALPQMLASVAEFYEEDVNTRMSAALSLIEPAIMIFMGIFVTFVLVALYLPIFSLADTLH
ncbi:MAG TPA: type II secretion system F family protein [Bryobacteraceae bacterium]|jgi:type IV pilus assembly protein PilC|nr:type II secretion system F family protein [Bryobacteraceae bacterium]